MCLKRCLALVGCLLLAIGLWVFNLDRNKIEGAAAAVPLNERIQVAPRAATQAQPAIGSPAQPPRAPFIVANTGTDSPGTNLETRVITFTADVGGSLPLFRQWRVNKGSGFLPVSERETNSVLVLKNARITDTGAYSLFVSNAFGGLQTTPVSVAVVEAVD